jgi:hypothetical protein
MTREPLDTISTLELLWNIAVAQLAHGDRSVQSSYEITGYSQQGTMGLRRVRLTVRKSAAGYQMVSLVVASEQSMRKQMPWSGRRV